MTTTAGVQGTLRTLWVGRGAVAAVALERVSRHPRGVEQTWTFDRAPSGHGALRVWVGVDGVRYAGVDDRGLRFADAAGGALRYGHATWVDARGARTAVPAAWNGSAIELTVPERVLAASTWPAVLDPIVGPEFPLDPTVTPVQSDTRVAGTLARAVPLGSGALAVWADSRAGQRLMARPIDASGAPQGASVIVDQQAGRTLSEVVAASDGAGALAAWVSVEGAQRVVRARRVDATGAPLGASSLELGRVGASSARLAIAGDPMGGWIVAWGELSGGVKLVRVARDGALLDATPIAVFAGALVEASVSVAAAAGGYLVAWADGSVSMTRYARVRRDGTVLDPGGASVAATARTRQGVAVGSNGTDFLLTWYDATTTGTLQPGMYGLRVGVGGPLDAAPLRLGDGQSSGARSVLFDGTDYAVVSAGASIALRRVTTAGVVRDATPRAVTAPTGTTGASLAATASGYVAALTVASTVMAQAIGRDGATSGAARAVMTLASAQTVPVVASDGREFMTSWSDASTGYRLARVSRAGVVRDAPSLGLTSGSPWLASSGTNYLMAWGAVSGVTMSIGLDGTAAAQRPLWTGDFRPRTVMGVTGGPGGYAIVTGGQFNVSTFGWSYYRVTADGTPVPGGDRTLVSTDGMHSASVEVALGASRTAHAAAWRVGQTEGVLEEFCYVQMTRMTPDGEALDRGIQLQRYPGPCVGGAMALASDGNDFLVVWPATGATTGADLVMARVDGTNGTLLDATPVTLTAAPGEQSRPAAVFDGTQYLVAWRDLRAGNADLYMTRVSRAGVVLDPEGVPVAAEPDPVGPHSLASTGDGRALVVYPRGDADGVSRAFGRMLDFGDGGVPAVDAGAIDAGTIDATAMIDGAASNDASPATDVGAATDVATTDVATTDVTTTDVATTDVATTDVAPDRATADGTTVDAAADTGAATDATIADATIADAGVGTDAGPVPTDETGCSVGGALGPRRSGTGSVMGLLALGVLARRRRRAHSG